MPSTPRPADSDLSFEAVPTQFHRPAAQLRALDRAAGGRRRPDLVPVLSEVMSDFGPADEDQARTGFFDRATVLRGRRPVRPPSMPSVIVDRLPALPRLGGVTERRLRPERNAPAWRAATWVAGALCGVAGVGIGVGAAFAMGNPAPAAELAAVEHTTPLAVAPAPTILAVAETAVVEAAVVEAAVVETAVVEAAPVPTAVEATPEPTPAPELLAAVREALDTANVAQAQTVLDEARNLPAADPAEVLRLDAELMVLRGDGALSVPALEELAEAHADPVLWVAFGRTLVQAERNPLAVRAFRSALELDPMAVDAHIELAQLRARSLALPAARRHLRNARAALAARDRSDPRLEARILVTEGTIALEMGRRGEASEAADAAQRLDPQSSESALLLARVDLARGNSPVTHLRSAVEGRAPGPIALGMLASRVRGEAACDLAARYLDRAPRGFDAPAMRRTQARCGG